MNSTPKVSRARSAQACEPCRALKVRCLSSSVPGVCQKCLRSKAKCVFATTQPRCRKPRVTSTSRLSALESKLDDLIARAKSDNRAAYSQHAGSTTTGTTDSPQSSVDQAVRESDGSSRGDSNSSNTLFHNNEVFMPDLIDLDPASFANVTTEYPCIFNNQSALDIIMECGVPIQDAELYLQKFLTMIPCFPFVAVPTDSTISSLCRDKPFTLLAALAASTSSHKSIQRTLEKRFRLSLLNAVMIEGERSLDLLGGILIYLGWYHFHYIAKKEHSYQMLQMAKSMVIDLGINLRPAEAMRFKIGLRLKHYSKADEPNADHDEFFCKEARRSYLGCFYISVLTEWLTGKPGGLDYDPFMEECALSLKEDPEFPSDVLVYSLVQIQNMTAENQRTIVMARNMDTCPANRNFISTHLHAFQRQLERWTAELPPKSSQLHYTDLNVHFAGAVVYEIGTLNPFSKRKYGQSKQPIPGLLDSLRLCFNSAKDYCIAFLEVPEQEYTKLSYLQWMSLVYMIIMLFKLSTGIQEQPDWDVRVAKSNFDLESFLDILIARTDSASPIFMPEDQEMFSVLPFILENVKQSYNRLKLLPQEMSAADTGLVHATSFPNPPKLGRRCPAMSFWSKQSEYYENDLLDNWLDGEQDLDLAFHQLNDPIFPILSG